MRSRRMPALLMTPSILPKFSTAVLIMRSAPAGSVTLSALGTALPPAAAISSQTFCAGVALPPPSPSTAPPRSFTTTLAPSLAASRAISRPMPPPAPVTSTTLSFSRLGISRSLSLLFQFRSPWSRTQQPRAQHGQQRKRHQADHPRHGNVAAADQGQNRQRHRAPRAQPPRRQARQRRRRAGQPGIHADGAGIGVGHDHSGAEAQHHVGTDDGPPGDDAAERKNRHDRESRYVEPARGTHDDDRRHTADQPIIDESPGGEA